MGEEQSARDIRINDITREGEERKRELMHISMYGTRALGSCSYFG